MPRRDAGSSTTRLSRRGAMAVAATAAGAALGVDRGLAREQSATPLADAVPPDFKVVLHAAQADHWLYVQSNFDNLQHEWPEARLRVVVDGNAVNSLLGHSDLTSALETAIAGGLELYICPNALHEHGIAETEIPLAANFSLGGVLALVLAHQEGYVYVKP